MRVLILRKRHFPVLRHFSAIAVSSSSPAGEFGVSGVAGDFSLTGVFSAAGNFGDFSVAGDFSVGVVLIYFNRTVSKS